MKTDALQQALKASGGTLIAVIPRRSTGFPVGSSGYFIVGDRGESPFGMKRRYFTAWWDGKSSSWQSGNYDRTIEKAMAELEYMANQLIPKEGKNVQ